MCFLLRSVRRWSYATCAGSPPVTVATGELSVGLSALRTTEELESSRTEEQDVLKFFSSFVLMCERSEPAPRRC